VLIKKRSSKYRKVGLPISDMEQALLHNHQYVSTRTCTICNNTYGIQFSNMHM